MRSLFTSKGLWENGLSLIRILVGLMVVYHGKEIFEADKMANYTQWMTDLKFSSPQLMAYLGKGSEFFGGLFLTLGLGTRLALIPLGLTMLAIPFLMGQGKIFMEDQHPFMFFVMCLVFLFNGAGQWSLDYWLFDRKRE